MLRKLIAVSLVVGLCSMEAVAGLAKKMPSPIQYATVEEYEGATGKKIEKFSEAPMLRIKVAAGELPPVEERLPEEPVVIMPVEEIGQYGGTWHRAWLGVSDVGGMQRIVAERIIKFNSDGSKIIPEIAKSWEVSEEGKVFTFYLRKGIRWSDGAPFTAEDIRFWYEDVLLNKELTPIFPSFLIVDGEPGKLEIIDDYTIRFRFKEPYGFFLIQLAGSYTEFCLPKHYLKQFHPRYTPMKKLEEAAKKAGFTHWYQLFGAKLGITNPDYPTLTAWRMITDPTATRVIMERNPYYWKVDPAGNQLPYIDRIALDLVENAEMINFKAMTGEIDMQMRHIQFANYVMLMKNREEGNYQILRWTDAVGAEPLIQLNQTCKDPVLRKLFQNDKFRKALSLAINRDEINEFCYLGTAEPRQASIISGGAYYDPEWEKAYAEYDPQKANALLDEVGLKWDKDHKYRLRPDGKILSLIIEFMPWGPWPDACDLVKGYWKAIGIKVVLKSEARSLRETRMKANEHQVAIWHMDRCANWLLFKPVHMIFGIEGWGTEYSRWYESGGKAGEKPAGDIARLYELWDKIKTATTEKERDRLAREVVNLHKKNIWMIGTVGELLCPVVVKNNFRNVPTELIKDSSLRTPGNANPVQFFIEQK